MLGCLRTFKSKGEAPVPYLTAAVTAPLRLRNRHYRLSSSPGLLEPYPLRSDPNRRGSALRSEREDSTRRVGRYLSRSAGCV